MTHKLTALLLSHRKAGTTIADLPADLVPPDLATAYAIQDEIIAALGTVGAWKVAPMPESGAPGCAPILAANIHPDGVVLPRRDFAGLAIEVEVAVTLRGELDARSASITPAEVRTAIGSFHIALELLASRYVDRKAMPSFATFADLQSNGGVVLGAPIGADTLAEFGQQEFSLRFDGAVVGSTASGATTANVLAAIAWLAGHVAGRGQLLRAGTVIITGARLGPIALTGDAVEADGKGLGSVGVRFS